MATQQELIDETARLSDVNDSYTMALNLFNAAIHSGCLGIDADTPKKLGELARGLAKELSSDRTPKFAVRVQDSKLIN